MGGKLRWKIVISLVLVGTVAGVSWFLLHRYQMRQMNSVFLEQSARAEDAGHADRAARFLRQYLLINRADVDARAHFGTLLEKLAVNARAYSDALAVYEQVLAEQPSRNEIRRRAATLSVR